MNPAICRARSDLHRVVVLAVVCLGALGCAGSAVASPTATVQATIDAVLGTLRDPALAGSERETQAVTLIARQFDFEDMTRRTLATNWDKADAGQRTRLVSLFRDLLVATYRARLAAYRDERVEIVASEQRDADTATVRTVIHARTEIPVDYKLHLVDGVWRAYDVVIEQVSLVRNYRGTFLDAVHAGGIKGLIETLERQVAQSAR